jgi:hypothetical protein
MTRAEIQILKRRLKAGDSIYYSQAHLHCGDDIIHKLKDIEHNFIAVVGNPDRLDGALDLLDAYELKDFLIVKPIKK